MVDTLRVLQTVSTIKAGQTFSQTSCSVLDHGSWYTSVTRKYLGETRYSTVEFLFAVVKKVLESEVTPELENALLGAGLGITNLKETYKEDTQILDRLDEILELLASRKKEEVVEYQPVSLPELHPVLQRWSRYQIETAVRGEVASLCQKTAKDLVLAVLVTSIFG